MKDQVFIKEDHLLRSFFIILITFIFAEVIFLYFIPDYFGIEYFNLNVSWNIIFPIMTVVYSVGVGIFRLHFFELSPSFENKHPVFYSILVGVNVFICSTVITFLNLAIIGLVYFIIEKVYGLVLLF